MADHLNKQLRSWTMAQVKGENTSIEVRLRQELHRLGYRFRLQYAALPGKPDIAFPSRRKVIFVNGCFWHQHDNCIRSRRPTSNATYWNEKLDKNVDRDASVMRKIRALGWSPLVVWECEMKSPELMNRLIAFLEGPAFLSDDSGASLTGDQA